jgi:hypothetical protein
MTVQFGRQVSSQQKLHDSLLDYTRTFSAIKREEG